MPGSLSVVLGPPVVESGFGPTVPPSGLGPTVPPSGVPGFCSVPGPGPGPGPFLS